MANDDWEDTQSWGMLENARDDWEDDEMSLADFIQARAIMGPILAISFAVVSAITSLGEAVTGPVVSFVGGLGDVVDATFMESIAIITAGAQNAANSLESGAWSQLGIFTYPVGIATVVAGLYVLVWAWNNWQFNPLGWLFDR